jgi:acyl CoA:acetate/3-ketoacid CoA transferase beta subunit
MVGLQVDEAANLANWAVPGESLEQVRAALVEALT